MTDVVIDSKDVVVEVKQPTVPTSAPPPKVGLVEINQVVQRGSAWMTGHGPPSLSGGQFGDMYLDMDTGDVYMWDGAAWTLEGTFAPSTDTPEEVLAKLLQVDGAGSGLDADLLDGQHGAYYATKAGLDANSVRDDGQDTAITTNTNAINDTAATVADQGTAITGNTAAIAANTAAIALKLDSSAYTAADVLTKIKTVDGPGSGLDADTLDGHDTSYFGTQSAVDAINTSLATFAPINSPTLTGDPKAPTPALADNDTSIPTTAWVKGQNYIGEAPNDGVQYARKNLAWTAVAASSQALGQRMSGLETANNGSWGIDIKAGWYSSDVVGSATNAAVFTKLLNAVWAAGSGAGGRDTATAIVAGGTYHLFALRNNTTGAFDAIFSAATTPAVPSGYSVLGRIRSMVVNAGNTAILFALQRGRNFRCSALTWFDVTASIAAGVSNVSGIPAGFSFDALVNGYSVITAAGSNATMFVGDFDQSNASITNYLLMCNSYASSGNTETRASAVAMRTDTGAQLNRTAIVSGTGRCIATVLGWNDWQLPTIGG